eukprot:s340_g16.t1
MIPDKLALESKPHSSNLQDLEARFTSQHEDALSQLTEELKQLRQDVAGKFRSAEENADALRSEARGVG